MHVHIRIESPAMKIRGSSEKKEFVKTADFIHEDGQLLLESKQSLSGSELHESMKYVAFLNSL